MQCCSNECFVWPKTTSYCTEEVAHLPFVVSSSVMHSRMESVRPRLAALGKGPRRAVIGTCEAWLESGTVSLLPSWSFIPPWSPCSSTWLLNSWLRCWAASSISSSSGSSSPVIPEAKDSQSSSERVFTAWIKNQYLHVNRHKPHNNLY